MCTKHNWIQVPYLNRKVRYSFKRMALKRSYIVDGFISHIYKCLFGLDSQISDG